MRIRNKIVQTRMEWDINRYRVMTRRKLLIQTILITSVLHKYRDGRCLLVSIEGCTRDGVERSTDRFLEEGDFTGIIGQSNSHGRESVYWKLLRNETFIDGALRICREILEGVGAGSDINSIGIDSILAKFTLFEHTFVKVTDVGWIPIEDHIRAVHKLNKVHKLCL